MSAATGVRMVPLVPPTHTASQSHNNSQYVHIDTLYVLLNYSPGARPMKASLSAPQLLPRQEVRQWTINDVAEWLVRVGLGEHAETFRANKVDGECLQSLNNDLLKNDLNIAALGNRQRILRKVQTLQM